MFLQISGDAIIGASAAIVGVVLGWILSVLSEVVRNKKGKLDVIELRSWGEDEQKNDEGFYTSLKIKSVVQINNNKNIVGCLYGWKAYICANGKKYSTAIYNSDVNINKDEDVICVQPREIKQIVLEGHMLFKTQEVFFDKFDNSKKEEYKNVGKVRNIDSVEIAYLCNVDDKEHVIRAEKFFISKY